MTIAGLVLAGGLSRRMGRDKASMSSAAKRLRRAGCAASAAKWTSSRSTPTARTARSPISAYRCSGIFTPASRARLPASRPAWPGRSGLVRPARDRARRFAVRAEDFVARLAAAAPVDRIAVARTVTGRHPVAALIPTGLAADLERWLAATETRRVNAWLGTHPIVEVDFPPLVIEGRTSIRSSTSTRPTISPRRSVSRGSPVIRKKGRQFIRLSGIFRAGCNRAAGPSCT